MSRLRRWMFNEYSSMFIEYRIYVPAPVPASELLGASMGASALTNNPTFLSIDFASFIIRLSYILDIQTVYPIIQTRPVTLRAYSRSKRQFNNLKVLYGPFVTNIYLSY